MTILKLFWSFFLLSSHLSLTLQWSLTLTLLIHPLRIDFMSDGVVCPICSREYELPRRFLVRADDIEFLPVPRKLGCLHTCMYDQLLLVVLLLLLQLLLSLGRYRWLFDTHNITLYCCIACQVKLHSYSYEYPGVLRNRLSILSGRNVAKEQCCWRSFTTSKYDAIGFCDLSAVSVQPSRS